MVAAGGGPGRLLAAPARWLWLCAPGLIPGGRAIVSTATSASPATCSTICCRRDTRRWTAELGWRRPSRKQRRTPAGGGPPRSARVDWCLIVDERDAAGDVRPSAAAVLLLELEVRVTDGLAENARKLQIDG